MHLYNQLPLAPKPIIMIGAGGIVNDAHLPAYAIAGFKVAGIYDMDAARAHATAERFNIPAVYTSMNDLLEHAPEDVVYDVALPASQFSSILNLLPKKAAVLLQKPMGDDIVAAKDILKLVQEKGMTAGVNFQLRYAPFIAKARQLLGDEGIGELLDIEINVNVYTPWHLWKFLYELPRVEILYHSIHYIDLVRSLLGNPEGIYAKTVKHSAMHELASVRSNIIMDYGEYIRANILTNHCHRFGVQHQQSYIKLEGSRGAIKMSMGLLQNYPGGMPDTFEYVLYDESGKSRWQPVEIAGSWFPHAFIGSMAQVMLAAEGSIDKPDNDVADCLHTMACVEAAYQSSIRGGIDPEIYI